MKPVILLLLAGILIILFLLIFLSWTTRKNEEDFEAITYDDSGFREIPEKPLFDDDLLLAGRPDFIVKREGHLIPVEMKSTALTKKPYSSHVFQLLAYCRLIEKNCGERPAYGILRYRNKAIKISYTIEKEAALRSVIEAMRLDLQQGTNTRSHLQPDRCRSCGYRSRCSEKLS